MDHNEKLTRFTANFIDELTLSGVRHIIISPGSRSTPLAMLCKHHPKVKEWILADERSAAYFALGIAKETGKPAALICTSGTAAANYYPAVVEASLSRVPLLIMTADRPHELRGVGAPQAIDQIHMYGDYVKDFQELALPEATPKMLDYARHRASRVARIAGQGNAGPVHVNFPFREPLIPDLSLPNLWSNNEKAFNMYLEGKKTISKSQLEKLAGILMTKEKGLIVCGPQEDPMLGETIGELAELLGVPVLADPLSQVRIGMHSKTNVIASYDALFRDEALRHSLKPEYILRFGAMPTSKSYRFYLEGHADVLQLVVEHEEEVREPTNHASTYLFTDSVKLCNDLMTYFEESEEPSDWLKQWRLLESTAADVVKHIEARVLTEGEAVRTVCETMPEEGAIFTGNSMPVRDLDTFLLPSDKEIRTFGNRGASGIDGIVSSALGVAAASEDPVTLIIGDLSFYHDLNGLLAAKQYNIPLTIILLNNNGGGIFSFLPQAKETKYFEPLFGTPLDIEFEKAVTMYGGEFHQVKTKADLQQKLQSARTNNGLSVIEVVTNRKENVLWHQQLWDSIAKKVADLS